MCLLPEAQLRVREDLRSKEEGSLLCTEAQLLCSETSLRLQQGQRPEDHLQEEWCLHEVRLRQVPYRNSRQERHGRC